MLETYTFTNTLSGLRLMLHLSLSLRQFGFTTEGIVGPIEKFGSIGNRLLYLEAVPRMRPSRKENGVFEANNPKLKI